MGTDLSAVGALRRPEQHQPGNHSHSVAAKGALLQLEIAWLPEVRVSGRDQLLHLHKACCTCNVDQSAGVSEELNHADLQQRQI